MRFLFTISSLLVVLHLFWYVTAAQGRVTIDAPKSKLVRIDSIEFDRDRVVQPCAPRHADSPQTACPVLNPPVEVSVKVFNPENRPFAVKYSVTGGTVIGNGAAVSWDLSWIRDGRYSITASLVPGEGIDSTPVMRAIDVSSCDCGLSCSCPGLTVTGGGTVAATEVVTFTANVVGSDVDYGMKWTVDRGRIVLGQGTKTIRVETDRSMIGQILTATVEIDSREFCRECTRTASATASIVNELPIRLSKRILNIGCTDGSAKNECDGNTVVQFEAPKADRLSVGFGKLTETVRGKYIWDLTGAAPGRHEIRGVDSTTKARFTTFVEVVKCDCPDDCSCPAISIIGPETIRIGQMIRLHASVSENLGPNASYTWTIAGARYMRDRGRDVVMMLDPEIQGDSIPVTLEVNGDGFCQACPRVVTKTILIDRTKK